jgi:hypothetical protein
MYKIIGADQKEYGPINAEQLRQWITEGRVNGDTKVQLEGTPGWKRVAEVPEFATTLPAPPPPVAAPPTLGSPAAVNVSVNPPYAPKTNQLALWSMITGIVSMLPCCCYVPICGPLAIIFGFVGLSNIKRNPQETGSGFAITGIVLGIISLLVFAFTLILGMWSQDFWLNLQKTLNQ